jgi:curved DNA-binding protein CbpA
MLVFSLVLVLVLDSSLTHPLNICLYQAYRKMSLVYHPDKNKDENATELFRLVAKASEVLSDGDQKDLYDYYLDNPRTYYKVSGVHFYKSLPKTDVRFIIAGVVIMLSILLPILQHQRHEDAIRVVREGLPANSGGSPASLRMHAMCLDTFRQQHPDSAAESGGGKSRQSGGKPNPGKKLSQIIQDPAFAKIVREMLAELKLEGAFRKPGITDVLLVQIVIFPYTLVCWLSTVSITSCVSMAGAALCYVCPTAVLRLVAGAREGAGDCDSTSTSTNTNANTNANANANANTSVNATNDPDAPQCTPAERRHERKQAAQQQQATAARAAAQRAREEQAEAGAGAGAESDSESVDSKDKHGSKSAVDIENEAARVSLHKILLSRVVGNSKKKQTGKNASQLLPFSKAEVKSLCVRIDVDAMHALLHLAAKKSNTQKETSAAEQEKEEEENNFTVELSNEIRKTLEAFKEQDEQARLLQEELAQELAQSIAAQGQGQGKTEAISTPPAAPTGAPPPPPPPREWRREDLSQLARALGKYPGGSRQRWASVSNALNDWLKPAVPFSPEECAKGAAMAMKHLASHDGSGSGSGTSGSGSGTIASGSGTSGSCTSGSGSVVDSTPGLHTETAVLSGGASNTTTTTTTGSSASSSSSTTTTTTTTTTEWTQSQQTALEKGMSTHKAGDIYKDASDRWALIAGEVPGKTATECIARYKHLRDELRAKKKNTTTNTTTNTTASNA